MLVQFIEMCSLLLELALECQESGELSARGLMVVGIGWKGEMWTLLMLKRRIDIGKY